MTGERRAAARGEGGPGERGAARAATLPTPCVVAGGADGPVVEVVTWAEAEANGVVISAGGEAVVIDPGTSPRRARALRERIEAGGDRVVAVVLTHAHWDHAWALPAFDGVPAYAARGAAAELALVQGGESRAAARAEAIAHGADADEIDASAVVVPGHLVDGVTRLAVGPWPLVLEPQPRAHSGGDLVVHVPDAAVSIVGDLVETAGEPQRDETSDVAGWLTALAGLRRARPTLIPGHGPPCGHEALAAHERWLGARLGT